VLLVFELLTGLGLEGQVQHPSSRDILLAECSSVSSSRHASPATMFGWHCQGHLGCKGHMQAVGFIWLLPAAAYE